MADDESVSPFQVSRGRKLFGGIIETLGVYLIWASAFATATGLIIWALHGTRPGAEAVSVESLMWFGVRLGWPVFLGGILAFLFGFALWGVGARLRRRGGRGQAS